jgi:hypothetical protein
MEVSGQHLAPATLPQGKEPPTHGIGAWADPRAGLDDFETQKKILSLPGFKSLTLQFEAQFLHGPFWKAWMHHLFRCCSKSNVLNTLTLTLVSAFVGFIAHIIRYLNLILILFFPPACPSMSLLPCSAAILCPQITDSRSHDCTPERQHCHQSLDIGSFNGLLNMRSLWLEECQARQIDGQILVLTPTAFLATCCGPYQDNHQALCTEALEINLKVHPKNIGIYFMACAFRKKNLTISGQTTAA